MLLLLLLLLLPMLLLVSCGIIARCTLIFMPTIYSNQLADYMAGACVKFICHTYSLASSSCANTTTTVVLSIALFIFDGHVFYCEFSTHLAVL